MTSKLTREQLHERARENVKALKMASRQTAFESAREEILADLQLAELALAAMESEPVAWTDEEELRDVNDAGIGYLFGIDREANKFADPRRQIMLYRHAQQPVVPEEATSDSIEILASARRRDHAVFQWDEDQRNAAADSWNACRAAILAAAPQSPGSEPATVPGKWIPVSEQKPDCWCLTCRPVTLNDMRFVVCPDCGNKRCPRANDHRDACTGSNEPGQEGSVYPAAQQEVKGE